ncbi:hypothetical protein PLESTB_001803000, partial [Pleodorina starrii]
MTTATLTSTRRCDGRSVWAVKMRRSNNEVCVSRKRNFLTLCRTKSGARESKRVQLPKDIADVLRMDGRTRIFKVLQPEGIVIEDANDSLVTRHGGQTMLCIDICDRTNFRTLQALHVRDDCLYVIL